MLWNRPVVLYLIHGISGRLLQANVREVMLLLGAWLLWTMALAPLSNLNIAQLFPAFFWVLFFFLLPPCVDTWLRQIQRDGTLLALWLFPLSTYQILKLLVLRYTLERLLWISGVSALGCFISQTWVLGFLILLCSSALGMLSGSFISLFMSLLRQTTSQTGGDILLYTLVLPFYIPVFILGLACWEACFEGVFLRESLIGLLGLLGINGLLCMILGSFLMKQHL